MMIWGYPHDLGTPPYYGHSWCGVDLWILEVANLALHLQCFEVFGTQCLIQTSYQSSITTKSQLFVGEPVNPTTFADEASICDGGIPLFFRKSPKTGPHVATFLEILLTFEPSFFKGRWTNFSATFLLTPNFLGWTLPDQGTVAFHPELDGEPDTWCGELLLGM